MPDKAPESLSGARSLRCPELSYGGQLLMGPLSKGGRMVRPADAASPSPSTDYGTGSSAGLGAALLGVIVRGICGSFAGKSRQAV